MRDSVDRRWLFLMLPLVFAAAPDAARAQRHETPTAAQRLVTDFVSSHSDVKAIELAVLQGDDCSTVAASDPADVGEKCDDDEEGPIRTGEPDVEEPTSDDPVYDITQALHDAAGNLIGAVGMDLAPVEGEDRAAAVERARALLKELEARIPSKAMLLDGRRSNGRR